VKHYTNRELSWLYFNERVIKKSKNPQVPFNERFNYLSISASNLDEFFMIRIAGIIQQINQGFKGLSIGGHTPAEQLSFCSEKARELISMQEDSYEDLEAELKEKKYSINKLDLLSEDELLWLKEYFLEQVLPIITPTTIDSNHPIPFIQNLELFVVFKIKEKSKSKKSYFSFIKKPRGFDRFKIIPGTKKIFSFETLINFFIKEIFYDFIVQDSGVYRIIRNSDLTYEEEAEDLILHFSKLLNKRRKGQIVRLDTLSSNSKDVDNFIYKSLKIQNSYIYKFKNFLSVEDCDQVVSLSRFNQKYKNFDPRMPRRVEEFGGDYFSAISKKDFIVHHPYESFDTVVRFLLQSSKDKNVISIKQTLYRTSNNSPIIAALMQAAFNGKSVTALIELKARFEEKKNIQWARNLEKSGVQVVYGLPNLKIHSKISLVARKESGSIVTYCHFGTGNYHPQTAKIYTDLSLFTKDKDLTNDAAKVFSYMTSYVEPRGLKKLSVAPVMMRETFYQLIDQEIKNSKKGLSSGIWAKMNSLVDSGIISKLYEASNAGVSIKLIVRGICSLQPGIKNLSENIEVKSIVGRFLEHSRIYCFGNGQSLPSTSSKVFISSADWMKRNIDRRVEILIPILNSTVKEQVLNQIMVANLLDNQNSSLLCNDQVYRKFNLNDKPFSCMDYFINNPSLSGRGKNKDKEVIKLTNKKINILCVCIHNSARSQMAEAFLNTLSPDMNAKSAGISPGKLNPLVVESMQNIGIDISKNKTKSVENILKKKTKFDFIIFVCAESQAENCPVIPYESKKLYWSIDDPSSLKGVKSVKLKKIDKIRDEIENKVRDFIANYKVL
jgi:polyphosphate kinase|tara:strand:- start:1054 stop:3561 length:2508 start_codon:yes stop_codon:yes gene_type:complete